MSQCTYSSGNLKIDKNWLWLFSQSGFQLQSTKLNLVRYNLIISSLSSLKLRDPRSLEINIRKYCQKVWENLNAIFGKHSEIFDEIFRKILTKFWKWFLRRFYENFMKMKTFGKQCRIKHWRALDRFSRAAQIFLKFLRHTSAIFL